MSHPQNSSARECLALPAAETARLLGISERHLWACHASGRLGPRPIALGRSKRWRLDELRAWLDAGAPPRERWEVMHRFGLPVEGPRG